MNNRNDCRQNKRKQKFQPSVFVIKKEKMLAVIVNKTARGEKNRQCEQDI